MKDKIIDIIRKFHLTNEIKTYNEAAEQILRLFDVSGQLPPPNCSKCGRSGYSSGKPFCTDDFCNGGNLR